MTTVATFQKDEQLCPGEKKKMVEEKNCKQPVEVKVPCMDPEEIYAQKRRKQNE